jgi:hypothetical protein
MIIMGGSCNEELMEERGVPMVPGCEYESSNYETFTNGFLTSFQIMTGEDWSELMFWYMTYSPLRQWSAVVFMAMWLIVHGIAYSLFVAVLLLNFDMEEDDKMPAQKEAFDARAAKTKQHASIAHTLANTHLSHAENESNQIFQLADKLHTEASHSTADRPHSEKSLMLFYLDNPFR